MTISGYSSELVIFEGFPFGGRCQNLLSYLVCEILKKFKSHLPHTDLRLFVDDYRQPIFVVFM